jgi:hypothetical protein
MSTEKNVVLFVTSSKTGKHIHFFHLFILKCMGTECVTEEVCSVLNMVTRVMVMLVISGDTPSPPPPPPHNIKYQAPCGSRNSKVIPTN